MSNLKDTKNDTGINKASMQFASDSNSTIDKHERLLSFRQAAEIFKKKAPNPTIDLKYAIDDPGSLYRTYSKRYDGRIILGMLFTIFSMAFEITFPYSIG